MIKSHQNLSPLNSSRRGALDEKFKMIRKKCKLFLAKKNMKFHVDDDFRDLRTKQCIF